MTAVLLYAISSFSSKSSCRKLRVDSDRAKCRAPTRFEQPFKGQLSASLPQGDSVLAAAAEKQLALQKKAQTYFQEENQCEIVCLLLLHSSLLNGWLRWPNGGQAPAPLPTAADDTTACSCMHCCTCCTCSCNCKPLLFSCFFYFSTAAATQLWSFNNRPPFSLSSWAQQEY